MGTRIRAHPAKIENSSGHWVAVGTQDPVLPPYELAAERCLRNLRCHAGSFDVVNAASFRPLFLSLDSIYNARTDRPNNPITVWVPSFNTTEFSI